MTDRWTISAGGHVYGPYTFQEMGHFASEGRLAPFSQVAPEGSPDYKAAGEFGELTTLFAEKGTGEGTNSPAVSTQESDDTVLSRYVIIAEMKSRSIAGIEKAIAEFGTYYPLTHQAWVLVSEVSLNIIRNALMQQIGNVDHLFIADTTHNKAVWFNYGPEAESRIRQTWLKA